MSLFSEKILVTGGTGHLGSALLHYLVQQRGVPSRGIRVFYLTGTPTASLEDVPGLELFPGDICDPVQVRKACQGREYIFHMAGSTSFDPRQKRRQWLVNVEGTRNILETALTEPSIKKICYTSTVNVLGVPQPPGSLGDFGKADPYQNPHRLHSFKSREEVLTLVERVRRERGARWERKIKLGYFDSKLAAQELVDRYCQDHGVPVVSVLPGTAFGPYDFLIGNGVYLLTLYRNRMPAVLSGGLSLAHVMDVAEGHLLAMEKGRPGEKYIITGRAEDNLYLKDMVRTIIEVLREKFPERRILLPRLVIPFPLAYFIALLSELVARLKRKIHRPAKGLIVLFLLDPRDRKDPQERASGLDLGEIDAATAGTVKLAEGNSLPGAKA